MIIFKDNLKFLKSLNILGLLEYQKNSYKRLFKNGIFSLYSFFKNYFPIYSRNKKIHVKFVDYNLKKRNSFSECKNLGLSYVYKLYLILNFKNKLHNVYICDIPVLNKNCSFLINGLERTLVSKTVLSPGVLYTKENNFKVLKITPLVGKDIRILLDDYNILYCFINSRKILITEFLKQYKIDLKDIFLEHSNNNYFYKQNDGYYISKFFLKNEEIFLKAIKVEDSVVNYLRVDGKNIDILMRRNILNSTFFFLKISNFISDNKCIFNNFFLSKEGRTSVNRKLGILNNNNKYLDRETVLLSLRRLLEKNPFDDLDNLENKRILCSGELILNSITLGFSYIRNNILENISNKSSLKKVNFKLINSFVGELFCSSNLSQFLEQTNLVSEITHKRRISFIKSTEKVPYKLRDVNWSFYGKICPVETPEGSNIGLVNSLSVLSIIDKNGFLRSCVYNLNKKNIEVKSRFEYRVSNLISLDLNLKKKFYYSRFDDYNTIEYSSIITDIIPLQILSVSTILVPFLEHNDASRTLMGANMQRQALPLEFNEVPFVRTGIENDFSKNLNKNLTSKVSGKVLYLDSKYILIFSKKKFFLYKLIKFEKTNQNTVLNQKCIINLGDFVKKGQILAENSNFNKNTLSLGRNVLVAFMTWKGFNYEDSIIVSNRLIRKEFFTTIKVEVLEISLDKEKNERLINITNNLFLKGIIRIGSYVKTGDVLVKKEIQEKCFLSPEEKLLNAIFKKEKISYKETSFCVPNSINGIISEIYFDSFNKKAVKGNLHYVLNIINDKTYPLKFNKIFIKLITKNILKVGDKMSGRHGNKGVVSKIEKEEDMPHLSDGTPCDVILNPLSITARMNLGQIFEVNLGWIIWGIKKILKYYLLKKDIIKINKFLNFFYLKNLIKKISIRNIKEVNNLISNLTFIVTPFNSVKKTDINDINEFVFKKKIFKNLELNRNKNMVSLIDGKTGIKYSNKITVGYMYYFKLYHIVDSKIHSRSIGPYSLVTHQPLKGRSNFGGQRLGEMEVWSLEAYGAAYILLEMITFKSDSIKARKLVYNSIINNKTKFEYYSSPESFNNLMKELNSLGMIVLINERD
ncbi:DNA-directed RNA polymerase subunit beta [Candidatus Vidania fulgoroideorum]